MDPYLIEKAKRQARMEQAAWDLALGLAILIISSIAHCAGYLP